MLQRIQERATTGAEVQQYRRRMLLALAILLTALIVMLVKDRSFWFGDQEATVGELPITVATPAAPSLPSHSVQSPSVASVSATPVKKHEAAAHRPEPASAGTSIVATDRAVLPPLEVEVVNDRTHEKVRADASPVKVDMQDAAVAREVPPVTNAVQRTQIELQRTSPAQLSYPSLASQMRVQGSVLLQALIGVDGVIQQVRVISGPAILSSAAREAAMQWRFKPYIQNGKPVETQARITVNFVIKVWDDEARNHELTPNQTAQSTRPGE